jgi:hypothetical protein
LPIYWKIRRTSVPLSSSTMWDSSCATCGKGSRNLENQRCLREFRVVLNPGSRRYMEQSSGVVDYRSVRYVLMVGTISTMAELVG